MGILKHLKDYYQMVDQRAEHEHMTPPLAMVRGLQKRRTQLAGAHPKTSIRGDITRKGTDITGVRMLFLLMSR